MPRMARSLPPALLLATLLASGCSASSSAGKTVSGWFGASSDSDRKGERVYYAAVEGLEMRAEPNTVSKIVASLRLREKVIRSKEKNGYAFVRARGGSLQGWVLNSKLDWRASAAADATGNGAAGAPKDTAEDASAPQPGGETVDATAPGAAVDAAVDVEPAEQAPGIAEPAAPSPSAEPAAMKKKGVGASVFDPY